jgi:hypothetical protein
MRKRCLLQQKARVKGLAANASSSTAIGVVLQMLKNRLTAEVAIMDSAKERELNSWD